MSLGGEVTAALRVRGREYVLQRQRLQLRPFSLPLIIDFCGP